MMLYYELCSCTVASYLRSHIYTDGIVMVLWFEHFSTVIREIHNKVKELRKKEKKVQSNVS